MKRFLASVVSAVLLIVGLSATAVFAVEDNQLTNQTTTRTNRQATLSDEDKKKLLERLAQRKTELRTRLTNAQKNRLTSRCKPAQGLIQPIREKIKGFETGRSQAYGTVITRLSALSTKLKDKGIDTTEFDASVTTLQGKVTTFTTDIATYRQAISDLADMDCATDPEAFKASLEAARTALGTVNTDASDIRAHIKDVIKPILADIRSQLAGGTQ